MARFRAYVSDSDDDEAYSSDAASAGGRNEDEPVSKSRGAFKAVDSEDSGMGTDEDGEGRGDDEEWQGDGNDCRRGEAESAKGRKETHRAERRYAPVLAEVV